MNVAGVWEPGYPEPLWIITDLDPKEALSIYRKRVAIEESFRDLKTLLCLEKLMNKTQGYLVGMVALMLMAYGIGLALGEAVREKILANSRYYPDVFRAVRVAKAQGEGGPGGRKEDHRTRPLLISPANSLTCPNSCLKLSSLDP